MSKIFGLPSFVHGVKALIYRRDARTLLQQRDDKPGLPFPGLWTFFGGQVEAGETLLEALQRELIEELGCLPGPVGDELFYWDWFGVPPARNHYFAVRCDVAEEVLMLNEGQAMGWFSLDDLLTLPTAPIITNNMHHIVRFIKSKSDNRIAGDL